MEIPSKYVSISYFPFFHTLKANAENGAMQFVKGTHKNGFYGQVRSQKSGNVLSDNLEIDIKPEWKDKIIQTQLVSGQCSFHDGTVLKTLFRCTYMLCSRKFFFLAGMLVHGSNPTVTKRRIGLTAQYIQPDVSLIPLRTNYSGYSEDFRKPIPIS